MFTSDSQIVCRLTNNIQNLRYITCVDFYREINVSRGVSMGFEPISDLLDKSNFQFQLEISLLISTLFNRCICLQLIR